ncbi:PAS domain-containing protein [Hymenobacter endophyticus]|uniref:PAS domain-containing protein n=1 Tax=Hymenobacter endophyticus TaxID=3076335 RepID=A0ABU3TC65_9BACT|nr:PAS domain-containing protein [Hymenobacter endophyticus]MDU0368959.1 PAS domain-containing protein [Hymenobacter endophyticus]
MAAGPSSFSFVPEGMFLDLLTVSLSGVNVLRPVYTLAREVEDFALEYLNPAAQRMTGLTERPGGTLRTRFPGLFTNGVFELYRQVMETGEEGHCNVNYQTDGLDNFFHVAARRSGEWLIISFDDTNNQPRTAVEEALRASQAAEQLARAEAEQQRQRFQEVLLRLPAYVAVYQGPDHIYQFVNPPYQSLFPHRSFLGRPLREGTPEASALGVVALFDRIYQTGEPYYSHEMEGWFDFQGNGQPEQVFLNLYLHPLRNAQGEIDGVLDFSYDVSEQVRARQQVQQLNQELEARVQERTRELAEQQRLLHQIMAQVPAAIVTLNGPQHRFAFANPLYQQLVGRRVQAGKTVAEMLPEMVEQGFVQMLDSVYHTGQLIEGREVSVLVKQPDEAMAHYYLARA